MSTDSLGAQATGGNSHAPAISADGRYVAFESSADNLVPGDSNNAPDIFLKDTRTGSVTRVSTDTAGAQAVGGNSHAPAISADGRYVAFYSYADNLVEGDSNRRADVFLKDTQTGGVTRVSTDSLGAQAVGGDCDVSAISADGRYVAFHSYANNLVAGDSNNVPDIFVKNTYTGGVTRVSTDSLGAEATGGDSKTFAISADGRYVAFESSADNLVAGDTNDRADVFVKDSLTGATALVSSAAEGTLGNGGSANPTISADGRYVAFASGAANLVLGDSNGFYDIFLKDTRAGIVTRISADSLGSQGNNGSDKPAISADGRYVAFYSYADNLVGGDTNGRTDVFVKDTRNGSVSRVSTDALGAEATGGDSKTSAISADGRYVTFESAADNLVPGDSNTANDVFVTYTGGSGGL